MEVSVPFHGFYETVHCSHFERLDEENLAYDPSDLRLRIAKDFTEFFSHTYDLDLSFKKLISPREYNFYSDTIVAEISLQQVKRVLLEVGDTFNAVVKRLLKASSGFIPSYSDDVTDWGDVSTWDSAQVGCVLIALLEFHGDDDIDFRHAESFNVYY